jgi:hypothetical protein
MEAWPGKGLETLIAAAPRAVKNIYLVLGCGYAVIGLERLRCG